MVERSHCTQVTQFQMLEASEIYLRSSHLVNDLSMACTNRVLGEEGKEWVRASLSQGKSLSWVLLSSGMLGAGSAYLMGDTPGVTSSEGFRDLAESISDLNPGSIDASFACCFELLKQIQPSGLVIVEDDVRQPNDRVVLEGAVEEIATDKTAVFHLRQISDLASVDDLRQFVGRSSFGYPLNALVTRDVPLESARSRIELGELTALSDHCCMTVHSAFDGDAIVIWVPENPLGGGGEIRVVHSD
jgi:hypothetical protein